jgi:hypothetical protein
MISRAPLSVVAGGGGALSSAAIEERRQKAQQVVHAKQFIITLATALLALPARCSPLLSSQPFAAAPSSPCRKRKHHSIHLVLCDLPPPPAAGSSQSLLLITPCVTRPIAQACACGGRGAEEEGGGALEAAGIDHLLSKMCCLTSHQSLARIQCAVRQKTARAVFKIQKQQHAGDISCGALFNPV